MLAYPTGISLGLAVIVFTTNAIDLRAPTFSFTLRDSNKSVDTANVELQSGEVELCERGESNRESLRVKAWVERAKCGSETDCHWLHAAKLRAGCRKSPQKFERNDDKSHGDDAIYDSKIRKEISFLDENIFKNCVIFRNGLLTTKPLITFDIAVWAAFIFGYSVICTCCHYELEWLNKLSCNRVEEILIVKLFLEWGTNEEKSQWIAWKYLWNGSADE